MPTGDRKPVLRRARAREDAEDAIDYCQREAGADVATAFVDALESAYIAIAGHPATGSPRYSHELNLPGLRSRALKQFPYRVFYVDRDDHIDVLRVLDARRDIPAWLADPDE